MIKDKNEAIEFCTKYGVELKKHKEIIVTSNGNIYLGGKVDPTDLGTIFYVKGGKDSVVESYDLKKEPKVEEIKEVKKPSKK